MIIFGTKNKYKLLGEGDFFCPKCQTQRTYQHKRATRYFSLYFIPVIPLNQLGEFVECQTCGVAFEPEALQNRGPLPSRLKPVDLPQLINDLPERIKTGTSIEYLVRDLTAGGVDRDVALDMINPHLAAGRKTCEACSLTYAAAVTACSECGAQL